MIQLSAAGRKRHSSVNARGKLRIATYHRVSTIDQRPELARTELRAHAARLGGHVVMEEEETGSGARNDRPGLLRIIEAARRGHIDCVVIWKLDRLSRSVIDLHTSVAKLDAYGVRLACVTQDIDTASPSGRLLFTVLSAVSAFERETIIERTRLGVARARARGVRLGRPKHRHPTPEQVRTLRTAGKSWSAIATELRCSVGVARLRFSEGGRQ